MLRTILIFIIIALIARAFIIAGSSAGSGNKENPPADPGKSSRKGVPEGIGEYVEYEEVDKKS
jgi:hypothetical protein